MQIFTSRFHANRNHEVEVNIYYHSNLNNDIGRDEFLNKSDIADDTIIVGTQTFFNSNMIDIYLRMLCMLSTCINPVLYGWINNAIRNKIVKNYY